MLDLNKVTLFAIYVPWDKSNISAEDFQDGEQEKSIEAELIGESHDFILKSEFRWSTWAAPKKDDGSIDHDNYLKGDDLLDFVKNELWPYLEGFKQRASSPNTTEYKIGEIFAKIQCKIKIVCVVVRVEHHRE